MNEAIKNRIEQVRRGEVPQGYSTEFGLAPLAWHRIRLNRVAQKRMTKNRNNVISAVLSNSAQHGVVHQRDFFEKDIANEENTDGYYIVEPNDYVYNPRVSSYAPYGPINPNKLGIVGIVSPLYLVFHQNNTEILRSDYLDFYFASPQWHEYVYSVSNQGARFDRMSIDDSDFFKMPIPAPAATEQQKIAEILACCDQVISLKKQLLDEKRRQKQWLVQKLLDPNTEYRVPGFENNIWKTFSLGDLGTFSKGTGISNEDCVSGEFPCIKYGDIYMTYDVSFYDAVSHTETDIASYSPHVEGGCLLFTGSGEDRLEIGKCTAYMGSTSLAVGGDIVIMKPKVQKVNPLFLAYTQFTDALIRQKARVSQGYSIVHLYADDIRKLVVDVPLNLEEQAAIVEILSAADREIDLLDQELSRWQQKKKALMQLLLMGIVRVNV
ncbi:MAG: hypothetical protein C0413_02185 [Clostridiales bacterium]|nr:hypothetical protein [Clostridiales bacterium]